MNWTSSFTWMLMMNLFTVNSRPQAALFNCAKVSSSSEHTHCQRRHVNVIFIQNLWIGTLNILKCTAMTMSHPGLKTKTVWAAHQKTEAHQKYLTGNVAADRMQTIGAAPFQPFSAHEYASKIELECLAAIAAELSFSKAHADKFAAAKIIDRDAVWLAQMSSRSMQALLGLPHALCLQFIKRLLDLGGWIYNDFEVFDKNCSEMMSMHEDE